VYGITLAREESGKAQDKSATAHPSSSQLRIANGKRKFRVPRFVADNQAVISFDTRNIVRVQIGEVAIAYVRCKSATTRVRKQLGSPVFGAVGSLRQHIITP